MEGLGFKSGLVKGSPLKIQSQCSGVESPDFLSGNT